MKYLFFDIECSNCFNDIGKICEFGYVITDENFKILRKNDIPMCPGTGRNCRFHLKGRKKQKDIILAYNYDYYYSCPEFPNYYSKIRELIENEDTIIFGYSVGNDIRYLDGTIKRYNLEKFDFIVYDIQDMLKYYFGNKGKKLGLKDALIMLGQKNQLIHLEEHLSRDDAIMSMIVAREMCGNLNIDLSELIDLCPSCEIDALPYVKSYLSQREERMKKKSKKSASQAIWVDFYRENIPLLEKEEYIGKIVTVSAKVKEDINLLKQTIDLIRKRKLVGFDRINGSDIIIVFDEKDKQFLLDKFKYPYKGKFVMLKDFLSKEWKI